MQPYGVVPAVNEFCIEHDWGLAYLTLPDHLYCDVAARKIKAGFASATAVSFVSEQRVAESNPHGAPRAVNSHGYSKLPLFICIADQSTGGLIRRPH